jgi:PelA/Pel-15E family pectate lyase
MKFLPPVALLVLAAPLAVLAAGSAPLKWSRNLLREKPDWFASAAGRAAVENVLRYQSAAGGWPKNTDLLAPATPAVLAEIQRTGKADTIDNQGTTLPLRFLAAAVRATGEPRARAAVERGLDYLLASQYPNGGFPQFYPLRKGYYSHVTFNDGAMVNALELLREVAAARAPFGFVDAARRTRAADAVARGLDCILRTQIRQDGKLTAWCAQHDPVTLAPAWARAYEPPSLSGGESVGIVRFLMAIEAPSPAVIAAVEGAVAWFRAVAITGRRVQSIPIPGGKPDAALVADPAAPPLWARFYELGTHRPLYLDRDSKPLYDFALVSYERRSGYGYHTTAPGELLRRDYPAWRARLPLSPPTVRPTP